MKNINVREGARVALRLVEPEDAEYIFHLRSNPQFNRFLSPVSGGIAEQRNWIEAYKAREADGIEFYYVILRLPDMRRCGVVRLYDIGKDSFTWGSFILDDYKPPKAALETAMLSFEIGFEELGLSIARIDVRKENLRAVRFYRGIGMKEVREDDQNFHFEYRAQDFLRDKTSFLSIARDGLHAPSNDGRETGFTRVINLPVVSDARGDLTFIEAERHVPFPIRRVYFLYNVPVDSERGGHAHRELEQVVFALSGSFRVRVDNGAQRSEHWLRDPRKGLYVNKLVWREIDSFSQGAVCMVVASHHYDEADYYRSYIDFLQAVADRR